MNRLHDYQTQTFNKPEQLEEVEQMITVALFALSDVTKLLKQIKCQKLYLAIYSDFFEYMEEEWGLDKETFFLQMSCSLINATIPKHYR